MSPLEKHRAFLTERQHRVLELRLAGHSYRIIARHLGITESTVRGHETAALDNIHKHTHPRPT